MATVQGTIQGIKLLLGNTHGAEASGVVQRKTYLVTMSFGAGTAGDVGSVSNLHTAIQDQTRNGRTFTIRSACNGPPGTDANGNAVYLTGVVTAGTTAGQVDFLLGGVTAAAVAAASEGVGLIVTGDES